MSNAAPSWPNVLADLYAEQSLRLQYPYNSWARPITVTYHDNPEGETTVFQLNADGSMSVIETSTVSKPPRRRTNKPLVTVQKETTPVAQNQPLIVDVNNLDENQRQALLVLLGGNASTPSAPVSAPSVPTNLIKNRQGKLVIGTKAARELIAKFQPSRVYDENSLLWSKRSEEVQTLIQTADLELKGAAAAGNAAAVLEAIELSETYKSELANRRLMYKVGEMESIETAEAYLQNLK